MKDCIVFGNGYSLKNFDFKKINRDKYDTVGCCLAFRYWDKINLYPDIYVNVDDVVCSENLEVKNFVMRKKCKLYLLSDKIKKVWKNYPNDGTVLFIQDLIKENFHYFKYIREYCSGSSAVILSLGLYNNIRLAGIDCDYVEFIPESIKTEKGSLKIIKTPDNNPNYFFDDYQREGDLYNIPNGIKVHKKSWEQLRYILDFTNKLFPENTKEIINYNNKNSIKEYFYTRPLNEIYSDEIIRKNSKKKNNKKKNNNKNDNNKNDNKIAFCIPTTSNLRSWKTLEESYLYKILLPSINILSEKYDIKLFVGYDFDDKLYSKINLPKSYYDIVIDWKDFKGCRGNPCKIWTDLSKVAIDNGYEYFICCGDDIRFDPNKTWLDLFIDKLKKNNNIGYSAGYSNNELIPTQFLFHKTHYEIFGWIFPPEILNWQCDDFIYEIYGKDGNWMKEFKHYNIGGQPRYYPNNCVTLRKKLVQEHSSKIKNYINKN